MTPHQFAKAACTNSMPDGICLRIEPASWHDYRVDLPAWLSEGQWAKLVADARERDELTIIADRRTASALDKTRPHANRHRLDLYYCPGCGCRMGTKGQVCLDCAGAPFVPDDADRRCLISRGKRCGYFERVILPLADQPPPPDDVKLQARQVRARRSYLRLHNLAGADEPGRQCPDCGGALPKSRHYCEACRRRRRQGTYRAARNRSSQKRDRKSLSEKGPNLPSEGHRPIGQKPTIPQSSVARGQRSGRQKEMRQ